MGERTEKFLDALADPAHGQSRNLRVFWNAVPHVDDDEHPGDKNWSASEPDPEAP
jgi:hypothetical protein